MNRRTRRLQKKHGLPMTKSGTNFNVDGLKGKLEPDYDEKGELLGYFVDMFDADGNAIPGDLLHKAVNGSEDHHYVGEKEKAARIEESIDRLVPLNDNGTEKSHFIGLMYVDDDHTTFVHSIEGNILLHCQNLYEALAEDKEMFKSAQMTAQLLMTALSFVEYPHRMEDFENGKGEFEIRTEWISS